MGRDGDVMNKQRIEGWIQKQNLQVWECTTAVSIMTVNIARNICVFRQLIVYFGNLQTLQSQLGKPWNIHILPGAWQKMRTTHTNKEWTATNIPATKCTTLPYIPLTSFKKYLCKRGHAVVIPLISKMQFNTIRGYHINRGYLTYQWQVIGKKACAGEWGQEFLACR